MRIGVDLVVVGVVVELAHDASRGVFARISRSQRLRGPDALADLKDWAALYTGTWDGVVLTPMERLGEEVVLTAWTKTLRLEPFDAALAAAFIDRYRGRGPEHPVRLVVE